MSAYIIGLVSQKGGVGKSTMARLLARELAQSGMRVRIADLDTQQETSTKWARRRAEAGTEPAIEATTFHDMQAALAGTEDLDAVILDGRPHASQQTAEIARAADLTLIPSSFSADDLEPAVLLAHGLVDAGVDAARIAFALVKTLRSTAETTAAREYLAESGYTVLEGSIPASTGYSMAHDIGRALTETAFRTLNSQAEQVAQAAVDRVIALTPTED